RRPRARRLRHPGGHAADVAVRAAARGRPGPARRHPGNADGRGWCLPQRAPQRLLAAVEPSRMAKQERSGSGGPGKGSGRRQLKVRLKTAKQRTASSQRWLERQLNDPYVAAAKREGYRSRAAFKLIEIDDKHRLLKPGKRVVDLGA